MSRFVRLDTLETVTPQEVLWGPPSGEVSVKRAHLSRREAEGRVPFLPVSARWAVRLVAALPLAARAARIAYLIARDGDGCLYCGRPIDPSACTVEHVVARAAGGPDHASNLALAHTECNAAAGHLSVAEKLRLAIRMRGVA